MNLGISQIIKQGLRNLEHAKVLKTMRHFGADLREAFSSQDDCNTPFSLFDLSPLHMHQVDKYVHAHF